MMSLSQLTRGSLVWALLIFMFIGCSTDDPVEPPPPNNSPSIAAIQCSSLSVAAGDTISLNCNATDADDDQLSYEWSVISGEIVGTGPQVQWVAPSTAGTYRIQCTVRDGEGGSASSHVDIQVSGSGESTGRVTVSSSPSGATIFVNGETTGQVTPYTLELPVGTYNISCELEGYGRWGPDSITVVHDSNVSVDAQFGNPLGLMLLSEGDYGSLPIGLPSGDIGSLPNSADLSGYLPTAGNQGDQGSCVGWAVGYGLKTYHEVRERDWAPDSPARIMSPAYIYNQIHLSGCNGGSFITDALNLLQSQGCSSLSLMPYSDSDCTSSPSIAAQQEAFNYRIAHWSRINHGSIQEIKGFIANDEIPVVICIEVRPDFDSLQSINDIYDDDSGDLRGHHAILIVGYSESRRAFKIMNSWGEGWGFSGFGWLSYDIVLSVVKRAYVAYDYLELNNPPVLSSPQVTPAQGNEDTQFTFSVEYYDADMDPPTGIVVVIDGSEHPLAFQTGETWNGVYSYSSTLSEGSHSHYFTATDGEDASRNPPDGEHSGPFVNAEPEINPNVTNPEYRDVFFRGMALEILWTSDISDGSVDIDMYIDGSYAYPIEHNVSNSGSYLWQIGGSVSTSDDCRIQITNSSDPDDYDRSSRFAIIEIVSAEFRGSLGSYTSMDGEMKQCEDSWSESSLNWNNMPTINNTVISTPSYNSSGGEDWHYYSIDNDIIEQWYFNNNNGGVAIEMDSSDEHVRYWSTESYPYGGDPRSKPYLFIRYRVNDSIEDVEVRPEDDSFVNQENPSQSYGNDVYLRSHRLANGTQVIMFLRWEDLDDEFPY